MWMPAQTTRPPFRTARSASGTRRTDRRVDDGRVERNRRPILRRSGPIGAERFRKALRLDIASAREGVDRAALPAGHLRDDMPGGAEAEYAEMLSIPRHDKRAPADQACAKQRCDRDVVAGFAERKAIAGIRDEMRGKAAVARVAGEARTVAQILLAAPAIGTFAAGVTEPGNADAFADLQVQ